MARITRFSEQPARKSRPHSKTECGYLIFDEDGQTLLQLDTYGSDDREIPGKVSQSLQLDRSAATQLIDLIHKAFPDLR